MRTYSKIDKPCGEVEQPQAQLNLDNSHCSECKTALVNFDSVSGTGSLEDRILHRTTRKLQSRAREGCEICHEFFNILHKDDRRYLEDTESSPDNVLFTYTRSKEDEGEFLGLFLDAMPETLDTEGKDIYFDRVFLQVIPAENFISINEGLLSASTSSHESLEVALQWVEKCASHQHRRPESFLPTRLVDVGSIDTSPCLVLSHNLAAETTYVTLSHCWGKSVPKRLLKENLTQMQVGINIDELSKTFQDAIFFTRRLGQRYLWIDSLCIIQDDLDDWDKESATMGRVYAAGFCNLSATAASDGSKGLFFSRNLPQRRCLMFQRTGAEHHSKWYYLWDNQFWTKGIEEAPLNSRAWVCQERYLSACNLHFGGTQLWWECEEMTASETCPDGFPDEFRSTKVKRDIARILRIERKSSELVQKTWWRLLDKYTASGLTKRSDKLPALAGMAATYSMTFGAEYCAGLWKETLLSDLLWICLDDYGHRDNSQQSIPSWSWASVDGRVGFIGGSWEVKETLATCLGVNIEPVNAYNKFGTTKWGVVTLNGQLALLTARIHPETFRAAPAIETASGLCNFDKTASPTFLWDDSVYMLSTKVVDHTKTYLLMPICRGLSQRRIWGIRGLTLIRDQDSGRFRRCGVFNIQEDRHGSSELLTEGCKHFESLSLGLNLDGSRDVHGRLSFTITLV